MTQKEALEILKSGHSAFITGSAGSGKTFLINEYIRHLKDHNVEIGITASTGIAATHLGGVTIHSWSGLGVRDKLSESDIDELEERSYLWKRMDKVKVLIIDEVSMLHHFRLDLVDQVLRSFKRNDEPFGGLQVILCGDFFQLPPISRMGEREAKFAYHSEAWKNLQPKICYLEEQHRQSDKNFLEVLNAIRDDSISPETLNYLTARFDKRPNVPAEPTKLYTHNANVDAENERELAKLPGQIYDYSMVSRGRDILADILKKSCLAPESLRLKKGARVMFVKNNYEEGYSNGTLGIVEGCDYSNIKVRTTNGKVINVKQTSWKIEEEGKTKAEITQYPLRLAWAITVHKSQGMSLDAAEIDLSACFEPGMGYVALSRVRSLDGLSLLGLNDKAFEVHPEVLEMDKIFRQESEKHAKTIRATAKDTLAKKQKEFIEKVGGQKKKGKKKINTVDMTMAMLAEKKTLREIADARGLTVGTVLDHAEKIKTKEPDFDFSHLGYGVTQGRFKKIHDALKKSGMQGGQYLLSPAKAILGNSFSFEEIRLVRLFM